MEAEEEKKGMTDEKLQDYEDGVKGIDHDGLFTSRSAENSESLKKHIDNENLPDASESEEG